MLVSRGYSGDVKKSGEDCKEKIRNRAVENAACQFSRSAQHLLEMYGEPSSSELKQDQQRGLGFEVRWVFLEQATN